ncbi:MAG: cellulose biosynthesis protein BcsG [Nitrospinae bacterium]|nr:cellulose biosynthesis protein BcsG [Nitrospinota bacterium]
MRNWSDWDLGMWSFYFLLKAYLYLKGSAGFSMALTAAFLVFVLLPSPERFVRYRTFRWGRTALNCCLGAGLLWHDSWLPPFLDAVSRLQQQGFPSLDYSLSFLMGYFTPLALVAVAALFLLSMALRRFRVSVAVTVAVLVAVPVLAPKLGYGQQAVSEIRVEQTLTVNPDTYLRDFYASESERVVLFNKPPADSFPFDIIFLHVCSLAWDDLAAIGKREEMFFGQFDYLFTNFNSATSYSQPALIRLFLANCGQRSHDDIHNKTQRACRMFETLADAGYATHYMLDHNGEYGDFFADLAKYGLAKARPFMPPMGLSPQAYFFDESPLYGDYDLLAKWLAARKESKAAKVALYYNSILLHAGGHWTDEEKKLGARSREEQFEDVESVLIDDLSRFFGLLNASGRNVAVVVIGEHGRALRAGPMQAPDLRDIPLPGITNVPVGIKLFGPKFNGKKVRQQVIAKPSSYLAVSWMLSKFVEFSPFGPDAMSPEDIAARSPKTAFVSENEGNKIVEIGGAYYFHGKGGKWIALSPGQNK